MTRWLSEFWVAGALVLVAMVIPVLWSRYDHQRRLELQQTAWLACWTHQSRKIEDCDRLRPAVLPSNTGPLCDMTGHLPRECYDLVHSASR